MNRDALLAALVTFCVSLALFLFLPVVIAEFSEIARTGIISLGLLFVLVIAWLFIKRIHWRRRK